MKHKATTLNNARQLRKNMTPQELKMWDLLRNSKFHGLKFKRQVPIGNYVADFVCEARNLIIELDGGQHNEEKNILYDKKRTEYFNSTGYRVLRFWNNDIDNNINGVLLYLREVLKI